MKKLFCSQPTLLICIELKLAEILGVCGIVGILYGFGLCIDSIFFSRIHEWYIIVLKGLWLLCVIGFGFGVGYWIAFGIYHAIKANWAWAERISKK